MGFRLIADREQSDVILRLKFDTVYEAIEFYDLMTAALARGDLDLRLAGSVPATPDLARGGGCA